MKYICLVSSTVAFIAFAMTLDAWAFATGLWAAGAFMRELVEP
jgi:hypothetical protein